MRLIQTILRTLRLHLHLNARQNSHSLRPNPSPPVRSTASPSSCTPTTMASSPFTMSAAKSAKRLDLFTGLPMATSDVLALALLPPLPRPLPWLLCALRICRSPCAFRTMSEGCSESVLPAPSRPPSQEGAELPL